ncbi:TPA: hypothetical protein SMF65_004826 [Serratia marcescens]|nr:hypothetical protein [Serratia marcescens]NDY32387.1 hypothetical protein [Serratia marcescens]NDY37939.1 hypothetical protein [Serratia marcescens]HEJ7124303.1 hypothetical protein [Serratia marcescens]HEJ7126972.1 hypothetical protein [Serratia marcescens]HEJ7141104.1 hypothetical protein [Serratia marcescens]
MKKIHYHPTFPFHETAMAYPRNADMLMTPALPVGGLAAVKSKKQTLI